MVLKGASLDNFYTGGVDMKQHGVDKNKYFTKQSKQTNKLTNLTCRYRNAKFACIVDKTQERVEG